MGKINRKLQKKELFYPLAISGQHAQKIVTKKKMEAHIFGVELAYSATSKISLAWEINVLDQRTADQNGRFAPSPKFGSKSAYARAVEN